ncbi:hypothetical protein QJS10_CPB19g01954 [Acorus calamus]|uniref:RRP12 N-terminal HEAT domain-containing protein n=1 Tax=Acorus calamus TaxID=4465 RepID=A0AAV9CF07_ACOCL|nr:hypothetical protein QJS10_CPB19g01954 [Acorus calamus]
MEGIEFEGVEEPIYAGGGEDFEAEDLSAAVLSRFMSSSREDHQHLCAAVGAMAQELKDQKLPLSPASFFAATSASLIRLSPSPSDIAIVEALLTFLSMVLTRVSPAVVRIRGGPVSEAVRRILGCSSASEGVVKAGMRCLLQLLIVGDRAIWSSVEPSYGVLLGFVTDDRPKVREQSHVCLRDALQSFQGSPLLVSASEGIMTVFERALLLAGGSGCW